MMKLLLRSVLLVTLVLLSLVTWCTWSKYRALHHLTSHPRDFTKLSNYTSDLVYQPPLHKAPSYRLLVVSLSGAGYYRRRSAVRSTWNTRIRPWNTHYPGLRVAHYFICFTATRGSVRRDLRLEAEQYGDIVIFSGADTYSTLPVQTLTALNWAYSQYQFDFILKTDDDSLVNIDEVLSGLAGRTRDEFVGRVYKHRQPGSEGEKEWVKMYHHDHIQVIN